MSAITDFLTRTRGGDERLSTADILTYLYLTVGTLIMFLPVLWLIMSSFKTPAEITEFPPTFLPYRPTSVEVEGYDESLQLYRVTLEDGETRRLAQAGELRVATFIDPENPAADPISVPSENVREAERVDNRPASIEVEGYDTRLRVFYVTQPDGTELLMARVAPPRSIALLVDPDNPDETFQVLESELEVVKHVSFNPDNYVRGVQSFPFFTYLRNSVIVTVAATLLTLLINSMAAYSLSKYEYPGRNATFITMIATLMIPLSVILVPAFLVIVSVGWNNNLLGVIVPGAATPTGVFLLRQYMLTIPDELIEAARIDGASEWRIFLQIILPLSGPALAVLAVFSVMWRWNDFLWPLIVLSRRELFTLQVGLASFDGQFNVQWDLLLPMTVLTLLPVVIVFGFLQRYISTGIATTGMK